MSGRGNSRRWKLAVKIALTCVLAADGALAVVNWRAASEAPQSQAQERANLQERVRLLAADVQKGREIERRLPNVSQECDQFYQRDLLPASSGDTAVISDIGEIARKAGVQTGALELREKNIKERGLNEVEISGSVQGNYQSLIQLIDGIERSPHFYLLEALTLSSEDSGVVKLQVALRTYFRT
jgi:Tfp pilus assembly protein PilO